MQGNTVAYEEVVLLVSGDKQYFTVYKWKYLISHLAHGGGHKQWT
jgi:hypothetical protein